ncbi:hypothetical protein J6590_031855 [Homalodisca vitripennis]|nr:hypothetical protein J6590_031855 [Homalodisca vitripennis]
MPVDMSASGYKAGKVRTRIQCRGCVIHQSLPTVKIINGRPLLTTYGYICFVVLADLTFLLLKRRYEGPGPQDWAISTPVPDLAELVESEERAMNESVSLLFAKASQLCVGETTRFVTNTIETTMFVTNTSETSTSVTNNSDTSRFVNNPSETSVFGPEF